MIRECKLDVIIKSFVISPTPAGSVKSNSCGAIYHPEFHNGSPLCHGTIIIYWFRLTNPIEMEITVLIRNFGTIKKFQVLEAGCTNGISLRKQSALYGRYGPLCSRGRENH